MNKLKTLNVPYNEFIKGINSDSPFCSASLAYPAAFSLAKNGFGYSWLGAILSLTFPVWIFFAIGGAIFYNIFFMLLILAVPMHFKLARKITFQSVWSELIGKGKLPYEYREKIYIISVKNDVLWSDSWLMPEALDRVAVEIKTGKHPLILPASRRNNYHSQ